VTPTWLIFTLVLVDLHGLLLLEVDLVVLAGLGSFLLLHVFVLHILVVA
jgi:hypothetical protein